MSPESRTPKEFFGDFPATDAESLVALLRATLEASADAILAVGVDGKLVCFNRKFQAMWDIPSEILQTGDNRQLVASVLDKLIDREGFLARIEYFNQHPELESTDIIPLKDGRLIERTSCPQVFGQSIVGRVVSMRDITARSRAEEELREAGARWNGLVNNAPFVVALIDREGRMTFVNRVYPGIPREAVIGVPIYQFILPEFHAMVREKVHLVFSTRVPQNYQLRGRGPDENHPIWYETWLAPIIIEEQVVQATQISIDITERKRAEEALKSSEERHRTFIENAPEGILLLNQEAAVTMNNQSATRITGITGSDLLSLRFFDLVPASERGEAESWWNKLNLQGELNAELNFINKIGEIFPVSLRATGIPDGLFLVFFTDVRQEREREERLRAALADAERATRGKSEFLANMSHEIRTPLNGVIGMTNLLLGTPLNEEQRGYSEIIRKSGQALLGLVNDILDIARIEAGKIRVEMIHFDIRLLMEEVMSLFRFPAQEKGLFLILAIPSDFPQGIHSDLARIRQVLTNLINNAIKFTEEGGINIAVELLAPAGEVPPRMKFTISDSGIGIPEALRHRLFEKFGQLDGSTSRKFSGTGLGLAISKMIVETLGGVIGFDPNLPRGSRFHFSLPFLESSSVAEATLFPKDLAQKRGETGGRSKPFRVLIVEDNKINQRVAALMIEKLGFQVTISETGSEAFALLQQREFQLVFMDVQMPGQDGLQTTKQIRQSPFWFRSIPIIAMTANAMPEDRSICLMAGMDDYLAKPIRFEALASLLDGWSQKLERGWNVNE